MRETREERRGAEPAAEGGYLQNHGNFFSSSRSTSVATRERQRDERVLVNFFGFVITC